MELQDGGTVADLLARLAETYGPQVAAHLTAPAAPTPTRRCASWSTAAISRCWRTARPCWPTTTTCSCSRLSPGLRRAGMPPRGPSTSRATSSLKGGWTHCSPARGTLTYPRRAVDRRRLYYHADVFEPFGVRERLLDLGDGRIALMDVAGVDVAVLSLTSPGCEQLDAAVGAGWPPPPTTPCGGHRAASGASAGLRRAVPQRRRRRRRRARARRPRARPQGLEDPLQLR